MGVHTQPITLEIWFKPDASSSYPANGQVIWETGGGNGLGIFYNNGMLETAHDSNSGRMSADVSALTGEFIQAVVTYDTTSSTDNFKLYVNGELRATSSRGDNNMCGGDGSGLGKRGQSNVGGAGGGDSNTESFEGQIAIFRSYHDQILDAAGVQANYDAIVGGSGPSAMVNLGGVLVDPENDPLITAWSVVSTSPADLPVNFGNESVVNTTATFTHAGTYTLRLTANDGHNTSFDDVVIHVLEAAGNAPPIVNAGPDQTVTDSDDSEPLALADPNHGTAPTSRYAYDTTFDSSAAKESDNPLQTGICSDVLGELMLLASALSGDFTLTVTTINGEYTIEFRPGEFFDCVVDGEDFEVTYTHGQQFMTLLEFLFVEGEILDVTFS